MKVKIICPLKICMYMVLYCVNLLEYSKIMLNEFIRIQLDTIVYLLYYCSKYHRQAPIIQAPLVHSKPSMAPLVSWVAHGHKVEFKDLLVPLFHHNNQHHLEAEIQLEDSRFQVAPTPDHLRLFLKMGHNQPCDRQRGLKWYSNILYHLIVGIDTKKHGIPLLHASITCLTIYFTQKTD